MSWAQAGRGPTGAIEQVLTTRAKAPSQRASQIILRPPLLSHVCCIFPYPSAIEPAIMARILDKEARPVPALGNTVPAVIRGFLAPLDNPAIRLGRPFGGSRGIEPTEPPAPEGCNGHQDTAQAIRPIMVA